jgi:hypothetical protein
MQLAIGEDEQQTLADRPRGPAVVAEQDGGLELLERGLSWGNGWAQVLGLAAAAAGCQAQGALSRLAC